MNLKYIIVFFLPLLLSATSSASNKCSKLFTETEPIRISLKGEINPPHREIVQQCRSSCSFEAFVSQLESQLTYLYGRTTSISRPHFYSKLLLYRLDAIRANRSDLYRGLFHKSLEEALTTRRLDLFSYASEGLYDDIVKSYDLEIVAPKNTEQVALENSFLYRMSNEIGDFMYSKLKQDLERINFDEKPDTKNIQTKISKLNPEIESRIQKLLTHWESKNKVKVVPRNIKVEVSPIMAKSILGLEKSEIVEYIKNTISPGLKDQHAFVLSYFHVNNFSAQSNKTQGFMKSGKLTRDQIDEIKQASERDGTGGEHSVEIVDIIFDRVGRFRYLVARNSWGSEWGDNGHVYLDLNYLSSFGREIHFESTLW